MPEVPSLALPQAPWLGRHPGNSCPLPARGPRDALVGVRSRVRENLREGCLWFRLAQGGLAAVEDVTGTPLPGMRGDRKCCQPAVPPLRGRIVTSPCRSPSTCLQPGPRGCLGRGPRSAELPALLCAHGWAAGGQGQARPAGQGQVGSRGPEPDAPSAPSTRLRSVYWLIAGSHPTFRPSFPPGAPALSRTLAPGRCGPSEC